MAGRYVLSSSGADKYHFVLKASNGETILSSESYKTHAGAENGIESCQVNSQIDARYEKGTSRSGQPYFNLKASNGQVIGTSEMYSSTSARDNGIRSVKENGRGRIDDQT